MGEYIGLWVFLSDMRPSLAFPEEMLVCFFFAAVAVWADSRCPQSCVVKGWSQPHGPCYDSSEATFGILVRFRLDVRGGCLFVNACLCSSVAGSIFTNVLVVLDAGCFSEVVADVLDVGIEEVYIWAVGSSQYEKGWPRPSYPF